MRIPRNPKQYELTNHLGNVLSTVLDRKTPITTTSGSGSSTTITHYEGDVVFATDYYPFGSPMSWTTPDSSSGRMYSGVGYRYGMNGKEKDDEIVGSGNSIDFGERMYDPRLVRMRSIDRYANKYPYMSPYSYAANNPIAAIDIAGDSLYILFHVTGNGHGDDMFKAAALTRQYDIEHRGHFDPKRDKVVVLAVQNMSDIKTKTEQTVADNKATYGNTVEFGLWSHSGLDGPIGTTPTTKNPLYSGSTQMNKEGWGDINFNWQGNGIYGCNSGNPVGDGVSFTNGLSGLDNFKDVTVSGQTTSAYPSTSPNSRDLSFAQLVNVYLPIVYFPTAKEATKEVVRKTYMVGGNKDSSSDAFFGGTKVNPMEKSKNGTVIK